MSKIETWLFALSLALCLDSCCENSSLRIFDMYSDGMVVQQNAYVTVKGTASPGAKVRVSADWGGRTSVRAAEDSSWVARISTPQADTLSHSIYVYACDTLAEIKDVLVGEVWMAAGQTNMLMKMTGYKKDTILGGSEAIRTSADRLLRFFQVENGLSFHPQKEAKGRWVQAAPNTTRDFSALAYFFARELRDSLNVPIGIVQAAYGGAHGHSFALADVLQEDTLYTSAVSDMLKREAELTAYRKWLDSLPSISVAPVNGEDVIQNVVVYDDYVNISTDMTSSWPTIAVPGWWEKQGMVGFDGVVWYAHSVEIPESWVGRPLKIHLGVIDDRDVTYINGKLIGASNQQRLFFQERTYDIPAEINNTTKMDIKVRVIDDEYSGGFAGCTGGEKMRLVNIVDNEEEDLEIEGQWHYMVAGQIDRQRLYFFGLPNSIFEKHPPLAFSDSHYSPAMVFNHIVAPWRGYAVRGVIWHQGESDVWNKDERKHYSRVLPKVLKSFRMVLGDPKLPIFISQLSTGRYTSEDETGCGMVRIAQYDVASADPYSYLVSTLDCGAVISLHPPFKKRHGCRMAKSVLGVVYGHEGFYTSGPTPEKAVCENGQAVISFGNAKSLEIDMEKPTPFEVAGQDTVFYPAKITVDGTKVYAFSYLVPKPAYVRFACKNCTFTTLRNEEGEPAAAFQIDVE